MPFGTLHINGREYVVIPKEEYFRLAGTDVDPVYAELGRDLREARERAGLTQRQLARKLKRSQTTVSGSESGRTRVSGKYVARVYDICRVVTE
jgi:ribosome-binding protein aMBF1 (putative translation factor)